MSPKFPLLISKTVLSILILLMAGCASSIAPVATTESTEYRQKKNYRLGETISVSVGEPIIAIQDFWLTTSQGAVALPNRDLDIKIVRWSGSLGGPTWVFKRGSRYEIKGEREIDGVRYAFVATEDLIPQSSSTRAVVRFAGNWCAVLVKADGTINQSQVWWQIPTGGAVKPASISDASAKFDGETIQTVQMGKGYENYEILYTGVNASGLNLTYREYSPEGLARVAFFQNLTYEVGVKNISFKKFKIAVESANSEKIVFRVVEDGFSKNAESSTGK